MFILSLPLLGLCSKSTSLSPGFCLCRPRQYDTVYWELNLISGFFTFFWLIVWSDGINKCGWCLAGGRGCWLMGPHQIPSVSWIFHHSLHFHIYYIISFLLGILCLLYYHYEWWGNGIGGVGWLIHIRVWILSHSFVFFYLCFCLFVSHVLSLFWVSRAWWLLHLCLCLLFVFFVYGPFN